MSVLTAYSFMAQKSFILFSLVIPRVDFTQRHALCVYIHRLNAVMGNLYGMHGTVLKEVLPLDLDGPAGNHT